MLEGVLAKVHQLLVGYGIIKLGERKGTWPWHSMVTKRPMKLLHMIRWREFTDGWVYRIEL